MFHDYFLYSPQKFTNVTNGIAYRRWLLASNPALTQLLSETIGDGFKKDAAQLKKLEAYAADQTVLQRLGEVKRHNKEAFAEHLKKVTGQVIDPASIFDVQVKRMHEYKRQHLNALNIAAQYLYVKNNPNADVAPKTYIFGAKAAPGYYMAKQMIRLICKLGQLIDVYKRQAQHLAVHIHHSVAAQHTGRRVLHGHSVAFGVRQLLHQQHGRGRRNGAFVHIAGRYRKFRRNQHQQFFSSGRAGGQNQFHSAHLSAAKCGCTGK